MAKTMRRKREKKLRSIKREIVEKQTGVQAAAPNAATSAATNNMDVDMGEKDRTSQLLKPLSRKIGKNKKQKIKNKNRGKGKIGKKNM